MNYEQLKYVFQNLWLWPLKVPLRPIDLVEDFKNGKGLLELISAFFGTSLMSSIIGFLFYSYTKDINSSLTLAVSIFFIFMIACFSIGIFSFSDEKKENDHTDFPLIIVELISIIICFCIPISDHSIGIITISVFACGVTSIGINFKDDVSISILCTVTALVLFIGSGVYLGYRFKYFVSSFIYVVIGVMYIISFILCYKYLFKWFVFISLCKILFLSILFSLSLPFMSIYQKMVFSLSLSFSIGLGIIIGLFYSFDGIYGSILNDNIQYTKKRQTHFLIEYFLLFSIVALFVWYPDTKIQENSFIQIYFVGCLISVSFILSGLTFYPLIIVISKWQCRDYCARNHSIINFQLKAPFRWQSFAYPLPEYTKYIKKVAFYHGCYNAYEMIKLLQFKTLQTISASNAASELAYGKTAISFCGCIATQTNSLTLIQFSICSNVARSIISLNSYDKNEDDEPLKIFLNDFWKKTKNKHDSEMIDRILKIRQKSLSLRIDYAMEQLLTLKIYPQFHDVFIKMLTYIKQYTLIKNITNALCLIQNNVQLEQIKNLSDREALWMKGGFEILNYFSDLLSDYKIYPELSCNKSKKVYLNCLIETLDKQKWNGTPNYWASIGNEIIEHWKSILQIEIGSL